jgi:colicin import membrane protein
VSAADIALKQKKMRELQAEQLRLEKLAAQKELKDVQAQHAQQERAQQAQARLAAAQAEAERVKAAQTAQATRAEKIAADQVAKKTEMQRYTDAIIDKIKSNIRVTDNISKGTVVQVRMTVLPDGSVLEPIRIMIPSGNKAWDEAALQGIMRSQPLPLPTDPALRRDMRDLVLLINYEK